jgi:SPP1 gp7 family putative phage head morphogenesis protein
VRPLRPVRRDQELRPTKQPEAVSPYLANLLRLAQLRGQPPVKTPTLPFPHTAEAKYRRKLTDIADASFRLVQPVIDELWRLQRMAEAEQARADADEEGEGLTPPEPEVVVALAQRGAERQAERRAAKQNRPHTPEEKAQLTLPVDLRDTLIAAQRRLDLFAEGLPLGLPDVIARDIERHAVRANLRVFESLGVNPIEPGSALDRARDQWIEDNAALISSQPTEVSERIGRIVREMVPAGARWETIARRLEDEHGIAQRRAALIARDQVGKYNGDCNRLQQRAAGFTHYEWIGVMDNRERPTHVALQHSIWSWDYPPPVGHPGEPIQCRCSAVPVTSGEDIAKTAHWSPEELVERTAELGPTQRQGEGATEEEVRKRAEAEVASEVRLAGRRAQVIAR